MNRHALVIVLILIATAADARQRMVEGVPWNAVDWETLCKSVKPLAYTSSNGQVCPKVHPADPVWKKWEYGLYPDDPEPKWRCDALAKAYERWRTKIAGCKSAFAAALEDRAADPEAYDQPFKVWRARYFGPWIQGD
jgi:hypothetical protein